MQVLSETEVVVRIDGPSGVLEAQVAAPRGTDRGIDMVICHPHPLHGGTKDNKVVHTLARAARDEGLRAVRFNFRGVGASAGRHDEGRGEVDDLLAVVDWCAALSPGRALVLAGFSFGAWIAAQGAVRLAAAGRVPRLLLLVAPPVHYTGFDALPAFGWPCTIFQGDADDVVDAAAVRDWQVRCQPQAERAVLPTGHFFHGALPELKDMVAARLRALPSLDAAGGAQ